MAFNAEVGINFVPPNEIVENEAEAGVTLDQTWQTDLNYFENTDEFVFMNYIREYPVVYDSALKEFLNRNKKKNAWRSIAKRFKATPELATNRYNTIRTRVGRYLRRVRPSGSGTGDFTVQPEYEGLKWLFPFIKSRNTVNNIMNMNNNNPHDDESVGDAEDDEHQAAEPAPTGTGRWS